jgi:hypothetical protein
MFSYFNARNLDSAMAFFDESLEFYHDKGGLDDYTVTREKMIALFERNKNTDLRREMVPGTQEVYPIPNYGAIETHQHRFCHTENGKQDCGTFRNLMIWRQKEGVWKVTRVVSYDH